MGSMVWASGEYPWLRHYNPSDALTHKIAVPKGYHRIPAKKSSFQYWLRNIPLSHGLEKTAVYLYNGKKKFNQSAHEAIINIDIGKKDLQQCADAVIRLRAEYLYSMHQYKAIHFKFTSGHPAYFKKWIHGYRPIIQGNSVTWRKTKKHDDSYANFRKYLDTVFMYAGTYSLSKELKSVKLENMNIGDIFIQGGFPGHAVIVIDMAVNPKTGHKLFLLAQSFMPAQNIHILKNPENDTLSPWYDLNFGEKLYTPEWTFHQNDLMRSNYDSF